MLRCQRDDLIDPAGCQERIADMNSASARLSARGSRRRVDIASVLAVEDTELPPTRRAAACTSSIRARHRDCRVHEARRSAATSGTNCMQQSEPLAASSFANNGDACDIAARPVEAARRAVLTGSLPSAKTIGIVEVAALAASAATAAAVTMTATGRRTNRPPAPAAVVRPSAQRYSIATFWPSTKPASFRPWRNARNRASGRRRPAVEKPDHRHRRLLRARRERPRRRRAAEQRDELAPLHSITSSARGEQRRRHGEAEHPGGLGVDDQLELGRLHDRQVRGLGALEDAAGIDADLTIRIRNVGSVAHQPAGFGKFTHRDMSRGARGAPPGGPIGHAGW